MTHTGSQHTATFAMGRSAAGHARAVAMQGGKGHRARAAAGSRRAAAHPEDATRRLPGGPPQRLAMATLGSAVIAASVLGSVVGHLLAATG